MSDKNISYIKGAKESKINIEVLCDEVSHVLQIDNLSFLIGAGCSSNVVNNVETGISGMGAIYEDFFAQNPNFEVAGQKVKGHFEHNLEKMLEVMGAIRVANDVIDVDSQIEEKIEIVQKFLRNKIIQGLESDEVKKIYKEFYSRISQRNRKTPISVFTTNYDLFNEMALDELGFLYNNGFSGTYKRKFSPASYNYAYVESMNLNRDIWERVSSFYNIVKLHGSISWLRDNNEVWERDYKQINDDETVMIYPTPMKDRTTLMTPYSDLFRVMENRILQKNSTLVVMGYSFSDDHINRIILNGLAVPSFSIVIFGQGANIDKLRNLDDDRIIIINSDDKIHYFKNIVEKVMPNIHPDVEETLVVKPVSQLIGDFEGGLTHE